MATQLLAKFEENSSTGKMLSKVRGGPNQKGLVYVFIFGFFQPYWKNSLITADKLALVWKPRKAFIF